MPEPKGDVSCPDNLDPSSLGFMCGLEIHQQLATGKLHSREAGELHDISIDTLPEKWPRVNRRLRVARGESGKVDVAARFEAKRNRSFIYAQSPNSGLIELDDQPPEGHDEDAVEIALTIAGMMSAHPVPLLQTMRKTVVDGSNTSGFQRTTLIATDGNITTPSGPVGVDVICLEEDSARKLDARATPSGEVVTWNLDRLGIPLVEIATAPDVQTPEHAKETAIALGTLLRDTRRVRRGLGSIRQDLNVSIACGDRVEIKGCQDLEWIPRIIRLEMARQLHFYRLASDLRSSMGLPALPTDRRHTDPVVETEVSTAVATVLRHEISDVGGAFSDCESIMIQNVLSNGGVMLAIGLPGLAGKLGSKTSVSDGPQSPRLGRELASAAKLAGVAGIFHSDELPAYGITAAEVSAVRGELGLADDDAFALCCAPLWQAELALESVLHRARLAWHRIPQEVRNVVIKKGAPEDGTTSAMRPLPGGARMYPETDIPPLSLEPETWAEILANLPLSRQQRLAALSETTGQDGKGISTDQMNQLLANQLDDEFHAGVEGSLAPSLPGLAPKIWASALLDSTAKSIAGGADCEEHEVPLSLMAMVLNVRESGGVTREGVVELASELLSSGTWPLGGLTSPEATAAMLKESSARAEALGLKPADASDLAVIVESVVAERADFITERGMAALGPLMGVVMAAAGGSADGGMVSKLLKEAIQKRL